MGIFDIFIFTCRTNESRPSVYTTAFEMSIRVDASSIIATYIAVNFTFVNIYTRQKKRTYQSKPLVSLSTMTLGNL